MIILGIESSCDDSCVAVIEMDDQGKLKVLSNLVSSQTKIHQSWGGIVPSLAKREHEKILPLVLEQALREANLLFKKTKKEVKLINQEERKKEETKIERLKQILFRNQQLFISLKTFLLNYQKPEIDFIAVADQPGLEPCLWVGKNLTQALSFFWQITTIKVNHLEAHILANWLPPIILRPKTKNQKIKTLWFSSFLELFPAICLVVSGGHTQLILMKDYNQYHVIGETRDDAAGECFDKIARVLGIGYPGGPAIATEAAKTEVINHQLKIKMPRPMIHHKGYDFSFSGLKTAVWYDYQKRTKKERESQEYISTMAYEVQQAIVDVLIKKTIKAAKEYQAKAIIIGGGVVANEKLRKQFLEARDKEIPGIKLLLPNLEYSVDNAAMIAIRAYFQLKT